MEIEERSKSKAQQKSLCEFNLSVVDDFERLIKPNIAVM